MKCYKAAQSKQTEKCTKSPHVYIYTFISRLSVFKTLNTQRQENKILFGSKHFQRILRGLLVVLVMYLYYITMPWKFMEAINVNTCTDTHIETKTLTGREG